MDDQALKGSAAAIDRILKDCQYQTLVHGDAKLANFCFSRDGSQVAAVDFQYVGGGCGMKDLAYFVGSCFRDDESAKMERVILDFYFAEIDRFLTGLGSEVGGSIGSGLAAYVPGGVGGLSSFQEGLESGALETQ